MQVIKETTKQVKVSIDRLTVVAALIDHRSWWAVNKASFTSFDSKEAQAAYNGDIQKVWTRIRRQFEGLDGLAKLKNEGICLLKERPTEDNLHPENLAYIEQPKFHKEMIRIDFNPNYGAMQTEAGQYLQKFLNKIEDKHFSRLDLAIDVKGYPEIANYNQWTTGVSTKAFHGRSGKLETLYCGAATSEKQVRFYNKQLERNKAAHKEVIPYSWWRYELQLRGRQVSSYGQQAMNLLKDFYIPEEFSSNLTEDEQRKLFVWKNLEKQGEKYFDHFTDNPSARKRMKAILKKAHKENGIALLMGKAVVNSYQDIKNQLARICGRFNIENAEVTTIDEDKAGKTEDHLKKTSGVKPNTRQGKTVNKPAEFSAVKQNEQNKQNKQNKRNEQPKNAEKPKASELYLKLLSEKEKQENVDQKGGYEVKDRKYYWLMKHGQKVVDRGKNILLWLTDTQIKEQLASGRIKLVEDPTGNTISRE